MTPLRISGPVAFLSHDSVLSTLWRHRTLQTLNFVKSYTTLGVVSRSGHIEPQLTFKQALRTRIPVTRNNESSRAGRAGNPYNIFQTLTRQYSTRSTMFGTKKFDPVADLADLSGKVVVVTGANTGIGYFTAKHLARKGAKVYLGSRSEEKGRSAIAKLVEEGVGPGAVLWLPCDLGNPALAKEAAQSFLQQEKRLDILVNNAGCTWDHAEKPAQDGITEMMMVNHIGTFQFTQVLLPLLLKTSEEAGSDVRIVTLSSDAHRRGVATNPKITFSTMDEFKNFYTGETVPFVSRYYISKLANVLFSSCLQRRISSSGIICIAVNPGLVNTSIAAKTPFPRLAGFLMHLFATVPDEGAYTSCFAAASPLVRQEAEKYQGSFLEPVGKIRTPSDNALRVELQDELWKTTEEYLASLSL